MAICKSYRYLLGGGGSSTTVRVGAPLYDCTIVVGSYCCWSYDIIISPAGDTGNNNSQQCTTNAEMMMDGYRVCTEFGMFHTIVLPGICPDVLPSTFTGIPRVLARKNIIAWNFPKNDDFSPSSRHFS